MFTKYTAEQDYFDYHQQPGLTTYEKVELIYSLQVWNFDTLGPYTKHNCKLSNLLWPTWQKLMLFCTKEKSPSWKIK